MDSTNQFFQELEQDSAQQQQQLPANSVVEELNELELDAIAGGMRTITVSGERPKFGPGPSMKLIEAMQSYFGK